MSILGLGVTFEYRKPGQPMRFQVWNISPYLNYLGYFLKFRFLGPTEPVESET